MEISRQIATLFERAAWFERSLGKAAALGFGSAWTWRSLSRKSPPTPALDVFVRADESLRLWDNRLFGRAPQPKYRHERRGPSCVRYRGQSGPPQKEPQERVDA
jgi:hypothetical protein